jgi:hypothetical protein
MPTLIFQLVLKQWDKSQRSPEFRSAIANTQAIYPMHAQPQFMLFDNQCVLDQHALDFTSAPLEQASAQLLSEANAGRTITKSLLPDGRAMLDRFILAKSNRFFQLAYEDEEGLTTEIGPLKDGWLQAKYEWRYRIEKNNEIFWQYEEVTLNAALMTRMNSDVFLQQPPAIRFDASEI